MVMKTGAGWLADSATLPTALRAVLGYYADAGVFDYGSLSLKREIDGRTERMVEDVFGLVEDALAEEFDRSSVSFDYDTKLILPAQLTLGYVYRSARQRAASDPVTDDVATGVPEVDETALEEGPSQTLSPREMVVRAEQMTYLSIEALVDGDMRDAINDDEFEDFSVDFEADPRRVAEVAQAALQADLDAKLEGLPPVVEETYSRAVDYSEAHQDRDDDFREMMSAAEDGDQSALRDVREQYKFADFEEPPALFDESERGLPYLKTQYARVGVLYDGMIGLYRLAGLDIDDDFAKAIVLAIIGAQVWLDDVDDYDDDRRNGQLTPVTAEYLLAPDEDAGYRRVVDVTEQYLDLAKTYATRADSPLTGIAVEYIYRSGEPEVLPGSP
ncbi:hypothetical protein SAMN05216559_2422 [Halomicrobium zhouii]|uniref:Uncharacterized protein n=1 Tax=Halomicrobium zhouii TaxID=767519 RepID=A0A1I6LBQ4_9EURY|nr:hypothetical protein [Halomicrobium zhouii]SFS00912.1 hypothetical protein SAMN05216559_2422 [Halomicrobium zhouii]